MKCCAVRVISNEPDFKEQKEWLVEEVEKNGYTVIFYPKYHCEFNFIEMIWDWLKSYHRRTSTYNYAPTLLI
jgi:transposase